MGKLITTLFTLIIVSYLLATDVHATQNGLNFTVRTADRKIIQLYRDSYALVVGNGGYRNGWPPLPGAIRDVGEVAKALEAHGFKVTLRTDLTKDEFNRTFGAFCHEYGRDEDHRLLFYYAGHGHTQTMASGEELGYLVMVEAQGPEKDAVGFRLSSVNMQEMVTQTKIIKARHVLFMFDSCFSSTILNLREQVVPQSISESVRLPVRQFIIAGRADEPRPDHSIYKQAFLDLLAGCGREPIPDGYVTGEELGLYLKNKVPEYSSTQHPQYGKIMDVLLNKGDFVFQLAPCPGSIVDTPSNIKKGAAISVDSNVSGAGVLMDGRSVGVTDLFEKEIRPGEYLVKVEKDGYESYTRRVKVKNGRSVLLFVDLQKETPSKGRLYVNTEPGNANVRVLNISRRFYQGIELETGQYRMEVTADGYEKRSLWVSIGSGEDNEVFVSLKKSVAFAAERFPGKSDSQEIGRDGGFIAYANGVVLDTRTGLMWAGKDNGEDINWHDAKTYCENYRGGGHSDWRMPTRGELAGLYDTRKKNPNGHYLTELIQLTSFFPWASETQDSLGARFGFDRGGLFWVRQTYSGNSRVLPVRSVKGPR